MATHTNTKQIPPRRYTGTRRVVEARVAAMEELELRGNSQHTTIQYRAMNEALFIATGYKRLTEEVKNKCTDLGIVTPQTKRTTYQAVKDKKEAKSHVRYRTGGRVGRQNKPKENCLLCSKLHKSRQCPLTKDWVDLSKEDTGYSVFEPSRCTYWKREDFLNSVFSAILSNSFRGGKTREEATGLEQEWKFACDTFAVFGDIGVFAFAKNTTRWCTSRLGVRSFAVACKDYQVFRCIARSDHELSLKLQCFKEHYILGEDNLLGLFELGR